MTQTTIQLDIVSDIMCPWCYIGKRRLERASNLVGDIGFDIRWRPYQLDATIPAGGMDRQTYLTGKFGSEQAKQIYGRISEAGKAEGLAFDFAAISRSPNTLNSHRLIRWSASSGSGAGLQDKIVERLFALYFLEGQDIGDISVLVAAAAQCGMDADLVGELLLRDDDVDLVRREIALAQAMGITGVPGFVFDNTTLVSGAQAPDILADVARKMAAAAAERGKPKSSVFDQIGTSGG